MFAYGLMAAFENDSTDAPVDEVEVMSEVSDAVDGSEEINTDVQRLDAAEADVGEVEAQVDLMDESIESGEGLSEDAARAVEISIERACNRLGMRRPASMKISREAFKSPSSRLMATRIAKEEAEEGIIKRVWNKIKEFVLGLVKRVKDWFNEKFEANNRLIRAAEAMKKSAGSAKGGKDAAFESKEARNFTTKTELNLDDVSLVLTGHFTMTDELSNALGSVPTAMAALSSEAESLSKLGEAPDRAAIITSLSDKLKPVDAAIKAATTKASSGTSTLYGGVKVEQISIEASGDDGKAFNKIRIIPAQNRPNGKVVVKSDASKVAEVCDDIIELGKANQKMKAQTSELDKLSKNLDTLITKVVSAAASIKDSKEGEGEKTIAETNKALQKAANALVTNTSVIMGTIPGLNLNAMKGAYEICRQVVSSVDGSITGKAQTAIKNIA